jgi:hypothetical protein
MLAVFGNPVVILAAALTVTLHHLILWMVLPRSVLNYDAPIWVVAVHAAFVVLVSTAACFIARSFFDNVIGLEKIVEARTRALDLRNRDMRLVLDNVTQGFVTIDRGGVLSVERSAILDRWFGEAQPGQTLFDLFTRGDKDFAARSRSGWGEVVAAIMPLFLMLEQMPSDLVIGDTHYRVTYLPIGEGEEPERFLVVVTDVTDEVKRRSAECERREAVELFERLRSDRGVVNDFFRGGDLVGRRHHERENGRSRRAEADAPYPQGQQWNLRSGDPRDALQRARDSGGGRRNRSRRGRLGSSASALGSARG